jgi:hypothetical protein
LDSELGNFFFSLTGFWDADFGRVWRMEGSAERAAVRFAGETGCLGGLSGFRAFCLGASFPVFATGVFVGLAEGWRSEAFLEAEGIEKDPLERVLERLTDLSEPIVLGVVLGLARYLALRFRRRHCLRFTHWKTLIRCQQTAKAKGKKAA